MKRVSFNVAKALKQAGYPQELKEGEYSHSEWDSELKTFVQIPYATEVWLWLWRDKKISLELYRYNRDNEWYVLCDNYREIPLKNDPEEAIIAAIEYLVDNELLNDINMCEWYDLLSCTCNIDDKYCLFAADNNKEGFRKAMEE